MKKSRMRPMRREGTHRITDRHAPLVFHFFCRMLGNEDDANDLAQETFVRVFRARESYKPEQKFST